MIPPRQPSYQDTHRFVLNASECEYCKDCGADWPGADEPCTRESEALAAALKEHRRATPLGAGLAELEETLGLIEGARRNSPRREWLLVLFKALQADVQHVVDLLRDAAVDLSEASLPEEFSTQWYDTRCGQESPSRNGPCIRSPEHQGPHVNEEEEAWR